MKILIQKQKLMEMLSKFSLNGLFYKVDLKIDNQMIYSHQINDENTIYRIANFKSSFFEYIIGSDKFIINVNDFLLKLKNRFKNLRTNEIITIEKDESELLVSSNKGSFQINTSLVVPGKSLDLVFNKNLTPVFKGKPLDTHFQIDRKDMLSLTKNLDSRDIFSIKIVKDMLTLIDAKRGNIIPKYRLFNHHDLDVTIGFESDKILRSFSKNEIHVYSNTGCPVWFWEKNEDFSTGVLIQSQTYKSIPTELHLDIYKKIITVGNKMGGKRGGTVQLDGKNAYVTNTKRSSLYHFKLEEKIGTGTFYSKYAKLDAIEVKRFGDKVIFKTPDGKDIKTTEIPNIESIKELLLKAFKRYYTENRILVPKKLFYILQDILVTKLQIKDNKLIVTQTRSDGYIHNEIELGLDKDLFNSEIPNTENFSIFTKDLLIFKHIINNSIFFGFNGENPISVFVPFNGGKLRALIGNLHYN